VFDDGEGYLATVSSVALTSDPQYVKGIGGDGIVSDLAYGYQVSPKSSLSDAEFAVYNKETGMLYVIDSNGSETGTYFDGDEALEGMYAFSAAGTRMVYVRGTQTNQELIYAGVSVPNVLESVITLDASQTFYGRPVVTQGGTHICMMVNDAGNKRIISYDLGGNVDASLTTPVQALTYSPNGNHFAWVDAGNQRDLVIYNAGLTEEEHRVDFSTYGFGAVALSWSPDNSRIAFFAGSNSTTGKLCVYTLGDETLQQILFDGTYEFPIGTDKLWAQPAWNSTGDELAFSARDSDGNYDIAKVDLNGNMVVLYENVGGTCNVDWIEED